LPEERGLLIAGGPGDGNRRAQDRRLGLAIPLARRADLGEHRARHSQNLEQRVVPVEGVDVEEQRPTGVADVGDVALAAGQPPDQERVDGAKQDVAALRSHLQAGHGIEQELELRPGEVRVEHQAGA
jgi:hypothetical protein